MLENRERERSSDANDSSLYFNKQCVHIYTESMWTATSVKERGGEKTPLGLIPN